MHHAIRRAIGQALALTMWVLGLMVVLTALPAGAVGGAYSIRWTAADPAYGRGPFAPTYEKLSPTQLTPPLWNPAPSGGAGRAADPLPNAIYGAPQDSVTSLAPPEMALGQIVPFEVQITVSGSTAPENGTIVLTPYFLTKTTNGGDFGYDPAYGIYSAFVDTADPATVNGMTAKVDSYSWSVVNPGTNNEQIRGPIQVSGLQDGDTVIVEIWVVLKRTIPAGTTGNVQTGMVSAATVATPTSTINTGNQTVPLLRVAQFYTASADVAVVKTDTPDPVTAGQQLTYTIVVSNLSTDTVANGIVVTDALDPNTTFVSASGAPYTVAGNIVTFTMGSLSPNVPGLTSSVTLQVVVTVQPTAPDNDTSTDPEPGSTSPPALSDIVNRVSVTTITSDPNMANNTYYQPTNVVPEMVGEARLSLAKSGTLDMTVVGPADRANPGDVIHYTLTLTNTGTVTVTNITVTDPLLGPLTPTWPSTTGTLQPGDSATFTGTYTLTQADIDAGRVTNTAIANGTDPHGDPVTDTDTTTVPVPQVASLVLVKTPTPSTYSAAGDVVSYSFSVTNTGNVTLYYVTIDDPRITVTGGPIHELAPGAIDTGTFTGTYPITQADVDAVQVVNTATAEATDSNGDPVTDTDTAVVTAVRQPAITLTKVAVTPNYDAAGDVISYSFAVTNTGNVTLYNVTIADPMTTIVGGPIAALAPGATDSTTFTGTYIVTQADMDAGQLANTATAHATDPQGTPVSDTDTATVPAVQLPGILLVKYVSVDGGATWEDANDAPGPSLASGGTPLFKFVVTNTGNVTLANVTITDDVFGAIGTVASLAPGAHQQLLHTGTWAIGPHVNTATAGGSFGGVSYTDTDAAHYLGVAAAAIDIEKYVWDGAAWVDADAPTGPMLAMGTNPQYKFVVTNTGGVTLTDITVTDDVLGTIGAISSLPAGATATLWQTGAWAVGQQVNTGTATGTHAGGTVTDSDLGHYFGISPAAIDIEKYVWNGTAWMDADSAPGPTLASGTTPQFRIVVTNTGTVTLASVTVTDSVFGTVGTVASLAPGTSREWTITGTWAGGQHTNVATATGTYNGVNATDSDAAHYFGPSPAGLDVEKYVCECDTWVDADAPTGPMIPAGQTPQFKFVVKNTGSVTLTNVTVTDDVLGAIGTVASLAPGASQSWIVTGTWAAGQQVNTASATGGHAGGTVTDSDQAHYFGVAPSVAVKKQVWDGATWQEADAPTGPMLPSSVAPQFRFVATNTGNVALTSVTVTDSTFGPVGMVPSLAPGASYAWTATGVWAAGQQANTATVTGVYDWVTYTATDMAHYFGSATAAVEVKKQVWDGTTWQDADAAPGPTLATGPTVRFRFVVTNTGEVTLSNVRVTDNQYGPIGQLASLAPGVFREWFITVPWAAGPHVDVATATGSYAGVSHTDTDAAHYYGTVTPALDVEKYVCDGCNWVDADTAPGPNVATGTALRFKIVVRNTGSTPITDIVVTDDVLGLIGTVASLVPGASQSWIVEGDWSMGQQVNTATATGSYDGATYSDTDKAYYMGTSGTVVDPPPAPSEVVLDNSDPVGVQISGCWILSSAMTGSWGPNYLSDNNAGKGGKCVTYTPDLPLDGRYTVYVRYRQSAATLASNVPVDVAHLGGTTTGTLNQRVGGGTWVALGQYEFSAGTGGSVTIRTTGTDGYVVADAVKFVWTGPLNRAPVAQDGALTVTGSTASGTLAGSDPDGDAVTYRITAQGALGTVTLDDPATGAFTYMPNSLAGGTDTFQFVANDGSLDSAPATVTVTVVAREFIVDNTDAGGVTVTGTWNVSTSSPGYWGPNYLTDGNTGKGTKRVAYAPSLPVAGTYTVYARYRVSATNLASNVPVDIVHAGGAATVTLNQRIGGGTWVALGSYTFDAGTAGTVTIRTTGTNGYVVADAVRFVRE